MSHNLLENSQFIDVHYHADPDLYVRRNSAIKAGEIYKENNGAVVLKSHLGSTAEVAHAARSLGLPVFGSLVLNAVGGGIDHRRVIAALANNGKNNDTFFIVHFPTVTGRKHASKLKRSVVSKIAQDELLAPEVLVNSNGKLKKEVIDILKLSLDYPIIISSGHASKQEVYLLIEACERLGVKKLMLNQPANPLTGLTYQDLKELSCFEFLWVEQTALTVLLSYQSMSDFSQVVSSLPRVIYSSDLGQTSQMDIQTWREQSKLWFESFDLAETKVREICYQNPMQLLT